MANKCYYFSFYKQLYTHSSVFADGGAYKCTLEKEKGGSVHQLC